MTSKSFMDAPETEMESGKYDVGDELDMTLDLEGMPIETHVRWEDTQYASIQFDSPIHITATLPLSMTPEELQEHFRLFPQQLQAGIERVLGAGRDELFEEGRPNSHQRSVIQIFGRDRRVVYVRGDDKPVLNEDEYIVSVPRGDDWMSAEISILDDLTRRLRTELELEKERVLRESGLSPIHEPMFYFDSSLDCPALTSLQTGFVTFSPALVYYDLSYVRFVAASVTVRLLVGEDQAGYVALMDRLMPDWRDIEMDTEEDPSSTIDIRMLS